MELPRKFKANLENLRKAITTLQESLNKDCSHLDPIGIDLIKNGRIQKFEYSTELSWKVSKSFIEFHLGIVSNSPKEVIRIMFREGLLDENQLKRLLKTIDDRNQISHIYREEMYDLIYAYLPDHPANPVTTPACFEESELKISRK